MTLLALLVALAACGEGKVSFGAQATPLDLTAYEGLGTWVDVYDYVPAFQDNGAAPEVTPDAVDDMAALGVRTLFLQGAQQDARSPGATDDPALLGSFLRRAH